MQCFGGALKGRSNCAPDSLASSKTRSPVGLPCSASMLGILPSLIVFYFVRFGCCLLKSCFFLKWDAGGVDPGVREASR